MKLAICNELFEEWPFDRAFAFVRECGYTGIELAPFTINANAAAITSAQRAEVRDQAQKEGLEVVGLHWLLARTEGYHLTSPDPDVRRRTGQYLAQLAWLCRDLGGSIMVFGSPAQRNLLPEVTHDQGMDYAEDVLRHVLPTLEETEMTLALEPLGPSEGNFLLSADSAVRLARRLRSPHIRLHLDVKAMSSETMPIPEIIRQHAEDLVHFHANDPNRQGPGMGQVDFVPIFQALRDAAYEGWVSVEVFDYSPGAERLARESIRYMQDCLRAIEP